METVIINGYEYQQIIEDGKRILTRNKNGFKFKTIMCGTPQQTEEFKKFVIEVASKNY